MLLIESDRLDNLANMIWQDTSSSGPNLLPVHKGILITHGLVDTLGRLCFGRNRIQSPFQRKIPLLGVVNCAMGRRNGPSVDITYFNTEGHFTGLAIGENDYDTDPFDNLRFISRSPQQLTFLCYRGELARHTPLQQISKADQQTIAWRAGLFMAEHLQRFNHTPSVS